MTAVAALLCVVFGALALIHFYWAAGGRVALAGAVPSEDDRLIFQPGRRITALVGCLLVAAAWIVALRAGLLPSPLPEWLPVLGTWALALAFAARAIGEFRYVGFFKRVRGTLFARRDSLVYSPLCAVVAVLAALLNLVAA